MKNDFGIVIGRKGNGKTFWTRRYVQNVRRLIVFDPKAQFINDGVIITGLKNFDDYLRRNARGSFRIVYRPEISFGDQDSIKAQFTEICRRVAMLENLYFVIDEINRCVDYKKADWFLNIVETGRHQQISMVATTIRYTGISPDLRANADWFVLFQTTENADINHFKQRMGTVADDLRNLPPFHYVKFENGEAQRYEPVKA